MGRRVGSCDGFETVRPPGRKWEIARTIGPMRYHVYLMTDRGGCSPLLSTRPLPWRALRAADAGFLLTPRGSYARLDLALDHCAEILALEMELAAERRGGRHLGAPPAGAV